MTFGHLKNLLLRGDNKEPVAITTALSGAGGFGKTTLAAALCHDEDIVQNFDYGVLWVTLGQSPNILGGLVTVYAALTGERPGFASAEDAAFQLSQKLEDRTRRVNDWRQRGALMRARREAAAHPIKTRGNFRLSAKWVRRSHGPLGAESDDLQRQCVAAPDVSIEPRARGTLGE